MSDPNWNWGDTTGRPSDRTVYNQGWQQQPSTYANPTQQKLVFIIFHSYQVIILAGKSIILGLWRFAHPNVCMRNSIYHPAVVTIYQTHEAHRLPFLKTTASFF